MLKEIFEQTIYETVTTTFVTVKDLQQNFLFFYFHIIKNTRVRAN